MVADVSPAVERRRNPVFSSADLVAGALITGIGAIFAVGALQYDLGTTLNFGPGMFPFAVAVALVALGVVILVMAFVSPSREPLTEESPEERVEMVAAIFDESSDVVDEEIKDAPPQRFGAMPWRALLLVSAAVVWFAVTVEGLGFVLASAGGVVLASYARDNVRWWQALAAAIGLTVLSWLIFIVALGLRVPLIGDWLGG